MGNYYGSVSNVPNGLTTEFPLATMNFVTSLAELVPYRKRVAFVGSLPAWQTCFIVKRAGN